MGAINAEQVTVYQDIYIHFIVKQQNLSQLLWLKDLYSLRSEETSTLSGNSSS